MLPLLLLLLVLPIDVISLPPSVFIIGSMKSGCFFRQQYCTINSLYLIIIIIIIQVQHH